MGGGLCARSLYAKIHSLIYTIIKDILFQKCHKGKTYEYTNFDEKAQRFSSRNDVVSCIVCYFYSHHSEWHGWPSRRRHRRSSMAATDGFAVSYNRILHNSMVAEVSKRHLVDTCIASSLSAGSVSTCLLTSLVTKYIISQ